MYTINVFIPYRFYKLSDGYKILQALSFVKKQLHVQPMLMLYTFKSILFAMYTVTILLCTF